jgi:hypothetical protein
MTERRRHLSCAHAQLFSRGATDGAHTANLVGMGTFPVNDPGLENVPGPQLLQAVDGPTL